MLQNILDAIEFAGDFRLDEVVIRTIAGTELDIKPLFSEINIYESIYDNAMYGNIVVHDSMNHIQNLPIIGQEDIFFLLKTPGSTDLDVVDFRQYAGRIYKVSDITRTQEREQVYRLHFTTKESIRNIRTRMSRPFDGTPSEIVEKIVRDPNGLNSKKQLFLEETANTHKIISPNYRPYQLIQMLCKRAESKVYKTPGFLFYENHRGLNFRSYESLSHTGRFPRPPRLDFTDMAPGRAEGNASLRDIELDMKQIREYNIIKTNDMIANTISGLLGSTHYTHDIHTKTFTKTTFDYFDDFDSRLHIDEDQVTGREYGPLYSNTAEYNDGRTIADFPNSKIFVSPRATKLHSKTSDDPRTYDNRSNIWLQSQKSNRLSHDAIKLKLNIAGNTYLSAGDVIFVRLPSLEPQEQGSDRVYDEYLSGRWIVTHLRHIVNNNEHEMIAECVKDTFFKKLPVSGESLEEDYREPVRGVLSINSEEDI